MIPAFGIGGVLGAGGGSGLVSRSDELSELDGRSMSIGSSSEDEPDEDDA